MFLHFDDYDFSLHDYPLKLVERLLHDILPENRKNNNHDTNKNLKKKMRRSEKKRINFEKIKKEK